MSPPKVYLFLPTNQLFQPLLADPRWPHFYVSFQRYINDEQLRNVASTNFGESFGIYRFRGPWKSTMELGFKQEYSPSSISSPNPLT